MRIWSAGLVQTNGRLRLFQLVMKARILVLRSVTEVKVPRRIACRSMIGEPDFDQVQPGPGRRREVHLDPWVGREPLLDLRGLCAA